MSPGGAFPMPPELEERLERLGQEFLADFLGRSLARHPDNFEVLTELATLLTRLGRLEEGLAADQRLVRLAPRDPTVHYNLACSLALLGRSEAALDALGRAIALGYRDTEHLLGDDDLASLRTLPRFQTLLASLRSAD
jgi:tetratricopeptide (TPR) repeat protein